MAVRRTRAWVAGAVAALVLAGAGAGAAYGVQAADHARARSACESAIADARRAQDSLDEAGASLAAAAASLAAAVDAAAALGAMTGDPVPAAAAADLAAAGEEARDAAAPSADVPPASLPDGLDGATTAALDDCAASVPGETARLTEAAEARAEDLGELQARADRLGAAFDAYEDAVQARGAALLAQRQDASVDAIAAFRAALDALDGAEPAGLPALVDAAVASAGALVATSDAARVVSGGSCWGDADDIGVLVDKHHPLCPRDYAPDLVPVASTGGMLRPEAAAAMDALAAALGAETGLSLSAASTYRSYDEQDALYAAYVAGYGQAEADTFSAHAGYSEHQTGLAIDVAAGSCGCTDVPFGDTPEAQWLAENAWRFGFIVRYPDGYEGITGYMWEPWHLRYVGVAIATAMHDGGIATLEEYYGAEAAPDYY